MAETIKTIIKTVPHPNPQQAIDVMARVVLNEILRREREASSVPCPITDKPITKEVCEWTSN